LLAFYLRQEATQEKRELLAPTAQKKKEFLPKKRKEQGSMKTDPN